MIYNHTRRNIVCKEVELAFTFFARFKGLMLKKSLPEHSGLLLCPCKHVHMFFMRFPLDVVFIDKEYKVVGVQQGLRPNQVSKYFAQARYALELPFGQIEATGLKVGDVLEFGSKT